MFIDPERSQLDASVRAGAPVVELHTGHYADAQDGEREAEYLKISQAVEHGKSAGLKVNAGHGLHYHNVQRIAAIPGISDLNIGHAIIARAVFTGLADAVRDMKRLMLEARL